MSGTCSGRFRFCRGRPLCLPGWDGGDDWEFGNGFEGGIQERPRAFVRSGVVAGDDEKVAGPGGSHVKQAEVFGAGETGFLFGVFSPAFGFGNTFVGVGAFGFEDGHREKRSVSGAGDVEVHTKAVCAGIRGISQEDDAGLEAFGLVEVHETDDVFTAGFQGGFFNFVGGVVDEVAEFSKDLASVQALGFPLADQSEQAEEVASARRAHRLGGGKGGQAQVFQDEFEGGGRGIFTQEF